MCLETFENVFASSFHSDNAWYTYVDRVESVREQRAIQESATQSPVEMTTPHNTTEIASI